MPWRYRIVIDKCLVCRGKGGWWKRERKPGHFWPSTIWVVCSTCGGTGSRSYEKEETSFHDDWWDADTNWRDV